MSEQATQIVLPSLHPGQRRVYADPARIKVVLCGRRWGKTISGQNWIAEGIAAGEPCAWFAPTYKLLDEPWRELRQWLRPIEKRCDVQQRRLEYHGGGSVDFWSMDKDDAGRGRKYKRVFVDEAGWVRNFEDVFLAAIYPTMTDLHGDAVIAFTPKGRRGAYRLFERASQGEDGMAAFSAKTIENPHIPPEEVERAKRILTPEVFKQEFEAVPADDGGNPFGLDAIRRAINPASEGPVVAWGVDLARSQDWTVAIGLDENGQVCRFERWQSDWGRTRQRLTGMLDSDPALVDSTGVGSPVVEDLSRACPGVEGFNFTQTSKQQIMEGLSAAFQTGEIGITDDRDLVNELESFGFEYMAGGRVRYEGPPGMHDDCVCALALAWQCFKQNGGGGTSGPMVSFTRAAPSRVRRRGVRACL